MIFSKIVYLSLYNPVICINFSTVPCVDGVEGVDSATPIPPLCTKGKKAGCSGVAKNDYLFRRERKKKIYIYIIYIREVFKKVLHPYTHPFQIGFMRVWWVWGGSSPGDANVDLSTRCPLGEKK